MNKYIAGANLIPLEKVGGGKHPIAVGEVWRRLFAKVNNAFIRKSTTNYT
jgi:hypothetical protein